LFRYTIVKLGLATPGRDALSDTAAPAVVVESDRGRAFVTALGGASNLESIDACTTRLRLVVVNQAKIDEAALRALGARGFVRPSEHALQVVLGPMADQIAGELRDAAGARSSVQPTRSAEIAESKAPALDVAQLVAALGGVRNLRRASANATRLCIDVSDTAIVNDDDLRRAGVRSIARLDAQSLHLIVGAAAPATLAALNLG